MGLLAAAAKAGDEHLQRVLDLLPEEGHAVLEAPAGQTGAEALNDMADPLAFVEQIGCALAPLHLSGLAHGAVRASTVTHHDGHYTLSLSAALRDRREPSAAMDVLDALAIVGLAPAPAPPDGPSLARWAREERERRARETREDRRRRFTERALAGAPPGLTRP
jgi:hypothetical protein